MCCRWCGGKQGEERSHGAPGSRRFSSSFAGCRCIVEGTHRFPTRIPERRPGDRYKRTEKKRSTLMGYRTRVKSESDHSGSMESTIKTRPFGNRFHGIPVIFIFPRCMQMHYRGNSSVPDVHTRAQVDDRHQHTQKGAWTYGLSKNESNSTLTTVVIWNPKHLPL